MDSDSGKVPGPSAQVGMCNGRQTWGLVKGRSLWWFARPVDAKFQGTYGLSRCHVTDASLHQKGIPRVVEMALRGRLSLAGFRARDSRGVIMSADEGSLVSYIHVWVK